MIDRLHRALEDLVYLTPDEQEELASYIEVLRAAHTPAHLAQEEQTLWQDPAGAWSDLPEHDEAEAFFRMRHETEPSPPVEL
jgi:hypothetical protein